MGQKQEVGAQDRPWAWRALQGCPSLLLGSSSSSMLSQGCRAGYCLPSYLALHVLGLGDRPWPLALQVPSHL